MDWSIQEENKLKELYLNSSLTLKEIAEKLGRTPPALNNRLAKMKVKRRLSPNAKHPKKITPALARIHAHICGDGCIYSYQTKDNYGYWAKYRKNPTRIRYTVNYCNNNHDLLKEFKADIYEVFGVRGKKIHKNTVIVNSRRIWDFLKEMGVGGSFIWRIPKEISNSSREVMKNWIRAFFDDEAYFNDGGRIRVKCVNKQGLKQLAKMVNNFVPCHLTPKKGFYWGKTVCININKKDAPKFFSKIGSIRYPMGRRSSMVEQLHHKQEVCRFDPDRRYKNLVRGVREFLPPAPVRNLQV